MPESEPCTGATQIDFFSSPNHKSPKMNQTKVSFNQQPAIPADYAHDPDLWKAIQASMGVEVDNVPDTSGQIIDDIDMNSQDSVNTAGRAQFYGDLSNNSPQRLGNNSPRTPSTATKNPVAFGPIFDESEFGPGPAVGKAPVVQQSALVNNINQ